MKKILCLILILAAACNPKGSSDPAAQSNPESDLIAKGKLSYVSNCMACHNQNPKIDGALGPAVYGSSLELLQARILKGEYPAGYTAKRNTKQMVALPHLEKDIPALHKYLNSEM